MKKFLFLFLLFFFLFNSTNFVLASATPTPARELEVSYPEIEGFKPGTVKTDIVEYVRYIYYFIIIITGFFVLGALVYGGFRYLTSMGNPEALKDAKDQIFAALLGALILLGSGLILYNINPQIVVLRVPILKPPLLTLSSGVWLCKESKESEFSSIWQNAEDFKDKEGGLETAAEEEKEEIIKELQELSNETSDLLDKINEKCYLAGGLGPIKEDSDKEGNYVTHVYLVPEKETNATTTNYAAILFEEPDFKGKNQLSYGDEIYEEPIGGALDSGPNPITKPSSIIPFIIEPNPEPEWKVTTYEEVDFNKGFEEGTKEKQTFPDECDNNGDYWCAGWLTPSPESIEIYEGAKRYIAILTKDDNYISTEVFIASDSNLLDNELIREMDCTELEYYGGRCIYTSAAQVIFLISGQVY